MQKVAALNWRDPKKELPAEWESILITVEKRDHTLEVRESWVNDEGTWGRNEPGWKILAWTPMVLPYLNPKRRA